MPSQSSFLLGDLCIVLPLLITYVIRTDIDSNPTVDVRGAFFNISKAADNIWDYSLIFKLKSYGVEGELLLLLKNYLQNLKQRVVLNGQKILMEKN